MTEENKIEDSRIEDSDIKSSEIKDSYIEDSKIEDSKIEHSRIVGEHVVEEHYDRKELVKEGKQKFLGIIQNKKFMNIAIIVLLLFLLIFSSWARLQNLPLLVDPTSGEYIPLALDPFYFLRVAETMVESGLPEVDAMRYPSLELGFTNELTPRVVVFMYNIANIFGDYSIQYIDVIYPVIFFIFGLIMFFILVYFLTDSKWIALLSSAFLAFTPAYLYRTMAGFADHESLGMFAFFSVMLVYVLSLKYLEKDKSNLIKTGLWAIAVAFLTVINIVSWNGVASFIFMIVPLSFFVIWVIRSKEGYTDKMKSYFLFYVLWVIAVIIFGLMFNQSILGMIGRFTSSSGIIGAFVFGFILADIGICYALLKNYLKDERLKRYRIFFSGVGAIILGIMILPLIGKNIISMMSNIWSILLQPFGAGRVSLTVAENAQPYLTSWISQIGKQLFWLSFFGIVLMGIELGRRMSKRKYKLLFPLVWVLLISGILFSRYSQAVTFNGDNFISKGFYLLGIIVFLIYSVKIYFNDKVKLDSSLIVLASLMLISAIAVRSASRVFFLIAPFACMSAGFFVIRIGSYIKKNKDELLKWFLILVLIISIIAVAYSLNLSYNTVKTQAKYTGPSANAQWQSAMSWVRNNTKEGSVFVHWWDYGYWVQYLGERPTITDGGHGNSFWDHLIGRYLLTSKSPEAALSFMKAQEVSYLLIDQTDLGKYPAYSKIGGDENYDSFSSIGIGVIEDQQTRETVDSITRFYNIGGVVDEDIIYEENGKKVFIPGPVIDEIGQASFKAYIGGILIESSIDVQPTFKQPQGIFVYNNQQINLPLRYIYSQGQIFDFGSGLDAVAYILPKADQNNQGVAVNPYGSVIYLSPKVSKSLFAQLYLMDDVFGKYPTVKLVKSELDPVVQGLNAQGMKMGDFVHFNGFRGPIKIWEINYPENIIVREEFTRPSGEYAEFDDLFF